jgi:hypothetical protein
LANEFALMLAILNMTQLVLYIALLSLLGQAVLHVLAGQGRASNVFYRVLQLLGSPFTRALRRVAPRAMGDSQVAWLTFAVLACLYALVTLARAEMCVSGGLLGQAGCR